MRNYHSKRDLRQSKYLKRGKSARFYGRVLIPVTMIVFGQAMWSDPVLGPQLASGLEDLQPVLASYAQGTPLDGTFGPVPESVVLPAAEAFEDARAGTDSAINASLDLPQSATPVNRP